MAAVSVLTGIQNQRKAQKLDVRVRETKGCRFTSDTQLKFRHVFHTRIVRSLGWSKWLETDN